MKVFLSAGHGGSDPGAVGNGLKEKDINLNVMLACNEVLVKHGVTTVLSRTKDENDPVVMASKRSTTRRITTENGLHSSVRST